MQELAMKYFKMGLFYLDTVSICMKLFVFGWVNSAKIEAPQLLWKQLYIVWYLDGYDKLKPFSLSVRGMHRWRQFLEAVIFLGRCPKHVR